MIKALSAGARFAGARLKIGVDHQRYLIVNDDLSEDVRKSLIADLAP